MPCTSRPERRYARPQGWVAEWFKAAVLKTAVGASSPWVRIPPLPPAGLQALDYKLIPRRDGEYFLLDIDRHLTEI